jgi:hypothetical protein
MSCIFISLCRRTVQEYQTFLAHKSVMKTILNLKKYCTLDRATDHAYNKLSEKAV